jgi:PAS domain S-box-containing protein
MSLRIKLTLFTVGFVLLASLTILSATVLQIRQKEQRDIKILRSNEIKRLQNNLQNSVDLICSAVEDRIGTPELPANLAGIIKKLRNSTTSGNADWVWVLDTGSTGHPIILSGIKELPESISATLSNLTKIARDIGEAVIESSSPVPVSKESVPAEQSHLYWYAQSIVDGGWVLAAAAPLSNLDSAVNERTKLVETEITNMIKDRTFFTFFLIIACAIAIVLFSKIISDPVNRLVNLTESIAEGRRGFTEQISVKSHDEIGRLAVSFNSLLRHVQDSMDKLEDTAAKYRELVENANSAIIHIDHHGNVLFINEYAQRLFCYSPSEVQGKNISETIGKPVEGSMNGEDMFIEPQKYPYLEREHITYQGTRIWVGWTNRPLFDKDQKLIETLCVGSDITKSKEAEELAALQQRKLIQADKMATLGILVSGVAHEINNPNNYIVLNAQTLEGMWRDISPVLQSFSRENPDYAVSGLAYRELSNEIPGMLKGISDGALRIKRIVQNLKDFSRMEPDDMTQRVDIAKVLDAAQIIIGNLIKKSTQNFSVSIAPDLPVIRGNFQRIEQVIINLLTNACQATEDPSKPVIVNVQYRKKSNDIVTTVSDKGKGISPLDKERIFDPFFTTKRDDGGTGLGLAVSYSIVKDHGGDLKLESQEGKGTTATLILPVV